jgi:hypothetical protein
MASQVKRDVAHAKSDFPKCPAEDSQGDIDKLEVGESSIMYHVAVVVTVFLAAALSYKPVIVSSLLLGTGFLFASYILYLIFANRQAAFPTARAFLEERVQEGLAVRSKNYDLYLPSKQKQTEKSDKKQQALLFLPGALVEHIQPMLLWRFNWRNDMAYSQ